MAVSADGRWFAGGRTMQDVTLWDLHAGKFERIIPLVEKPDPKGSDHVKRVAFSADGKVLFTGSGKTGITAWEVPTGKKLWNTPGVGPWLAVDPKGRWVAAGGGFNQQPGPVDAAQPGDRGGDPPGGRAAGRRVAGPSWPSHYPPYISDLRFTPDGSRLLTAHYDQTVRVWAPDAGPEVGRLTGTGPGSSLAISADGRWVGVGQPDHKITVWELASGRRLLELTGHDSTVRDVAFTADGRGIIGNADLAPVLWSLEARDNSKADDAAWAVLAEEDGAKAYRVQWALLKDPAAAVKLLAEKVKPAELALERARFDRWVTDLDSPQFRVREAAERELTKAGMRVPLGWVRRRWRTRRRTSRGPGWGGCWPSGRSRTRRSGGCSRAVQVLELAGTPEAVALLKAWAAVDGSPVTASSREAVGRLTGR